jgi:hypothetical protein
MQKNGESNIYKGKNEISCSQLQKIVESDIHSISIMRAFIQNAVEKGAEIG